MCCAANRSGTAYRQRDCRPEHRILSLNIQKRTEEKEIEKRANSDGL